MTDQEATFEPLDFRKRSLITVNPNQYRVVSLSGEIQEIHANTAYEAFRQSGLGEAIKIERIFIHERNVIPKTDFSDTAAFAASIDADAAFVLSDGKDADPLAYFRRRKNPIISAAELDALMRALNAMEAEPFEETASTDEPESQALPSASVPADHNERVSVPAPAPADGSVLDAGITGRDIHGDGFDEIVPSSPPLAAQKPPAGAAPAQAVAAPSIPERELSAEEIDALLGDDKP